MTKQNEIIAWFKTDRSFEAGKQLFLKYGGSLSFKTNLNRVGNTPDNYKFLCYELSKIAGISESQYKNMFKKPLFKVVSDDVRKKTETDINSLSIEELICDFTSLDLSKLKYPAVVKLVKEFEIKSKSKKIKDLIHLLQNLQKKNIVASVPVEIKRTFKLREEFPFLKQKESPGILKELVADMLTAYDNYVEGHKQLVDSLDEETIATLSKEVVENYLENRQIWDELNHFKETKELLGKHPLFEWIARREEIRGLPTAELVKLKDQLVNKIPRTKKKIADEPDHKETDSRQKRVDQFEMELTEVKLLLGIKDEE